MHAASVPAIFFFSFLISCNLQGKCIFSFVCFASKKAHGLSYRPMVCHIGHASFHTPNRNLLINNILHIPKATKNLVSVHCLVFDNNAYLEFHLDCFLIKDQASNRTLLHGTCNGGFVHYRPMLRFRKISPWCGETDVFQVAQESCTPCLSASFSLIKSFLCPRV